MASPDKFKEKLVKHNIGLDIIEKINGDYEELVSDSSKIKKREYFKHAMDFAKQTQHVKNHRKNLQKRTYEAPFTISCLYRAMKKRIDGFDNFLFLLFRHTYTSKLLANGAAPKDVQELLGHNDINTTLNVNAHATRESRRNSAMLLETTAKAV